MSEFEEFDNPLNETGSDEPQSMSLMGGIASGGGALPGGEFSLGEGNESKKIAQQSVLIGLTVTVVAFGALMLMRVTQNDASAASVSADTMQFMTDLESRIENMDKLGTSDPLNPENLKKLFDTDDIVAAIEDDPTEKQVPIDQVQMNPFTSVNAKPAAQVVVDDAAILEAQRVTKLQALYGELTSIEIQSLVGGKRPAAFIGGDLLKVGDKIGSFIIRDIDNRRIVFDAAGFELRPGEAAFALGIKNDR